MLFHFFNNFWKWIYASDQFTTLILKGYYSHECLSLTNFKRYENWHLWSFIYFNLVTSNFIFVTYDYAYENVKVIRWLWRKSKSLWIDQQHIVSKMFIKQTIDLFEHRIDENSIKALRRGNRYKQYKFSMLIDNKNHIKLRW